MKPENLQKIIALRHELHAHPELSMQEYETKKQLIRFLTENTDLEIVDCGAWFYACCHAERISDAADSAGSDGTNSDSPDNMDSNNPDGTGSSSADSAPIAFRAEFDALPVPETLPLSYGSVNPGISHKCGHDGHSAALAGLALELNDRIRENADKKDAVSRSFPRRDVYFIFQPGEETGEGGSLCAPLIRKKEIREVYACHNMSGYPKGSIIVKEGTMWCASKGVTLHYQGKNSHASLPEQGHNPALSIATLVMYLQGCLQYGPAGKGWRAMVLGTVVGIRVGAGDFGVNPGDGEISFTLRGENEDEMLKLEEMLISMANEMAEAEHLTLTVTESDVFPETRNDALCVKKISGQAVASGLLVIHPEDPIRSSEDFGWLTKECAGGSFLIGNGEDYAPIHTPEFDYPDDELETTVELFLSLI